MKPIFVTGAGTGVGKTYFACALARMLRQEGVRVDALKPIVTGFDAAAPQGSDPFLLCEALGLAPDAANLARISPWRFKAPLAANMAARLEGVNLAHDEVLRLCRARVAEAQADGTALVIEGAGGVMAPVDDDHTMLDLIERLDCEVWLVTGSYLGAISHTLTALVAMAAQGIIPQIMVCESEDGVDLGETMRALRRLAPARAFSLMRRGAPFGESE